MINTPDVLLVLILLSVLLSIGGSRLQEFIRIMSFQGVLVSLVPFLLERHEQTSWIDIGFLLVLIAIKGGIIPFLLWFASRKVAIKRDVEPIVGYHASILTGLFIILTAAFISNRMEPVSLSGHQLLLPAAFTTLAAGLFLMMARRKAITQVIGYLMMENGIYLAGSALAKQTHTQFIVEFGVLLDLLVGIMIMGIILHQISHSFDDADTMFLEQLKG